MSDGQAVQALATYLIEHDPNGQHVEVWVEEWTEAELARTRREPSWIPSRFRWRHPTLTWPTEREHS